MDKNVLVSFLSGTISGSISKLLTHPMDTIKANLQVNQDKKFQGISNIFNKTYKEEGIKGFYKGISISVIGSIPASGLYFGSYEYAKKNLIKGDFFKRHEAISHFLGGIFAEAISCIFWVPIDIIKERRQVQNTLKTYDYKSDFHALTTILNTEGVKGIYKAYLATIGSFGPTTALYFMIYEKSKGYFVKNDHKAYLNSIAENKVIKLSFYQSIICSMTAAGLSSFITTPLDLIKFRMQIQRASTDYNKETAVYKNMIQGLFKIISNEGYKALYRGSLARVLSMMPQGAIIMTLVEQIKPIVNNILN